MKAIGYLLGVALALCPLTLKADTWTDENGVEWQYITYNGEARIDRISKYAAGAITIPETLGGCPVTTVGYSAFYECSMITSIHFPETVTRLGEKSFWGCSSLSLTLPSHITTIDLSALAFVPNLTVEEGRTFFNADWFYESGRYAKPNMLDLPASLVTIHVPESGKFSVHTLYIHGGYRDFYQLFACSNAIYYEAKYAYDWKAHQAGWCCEASQLTVIPTLHGGHTSEQGRYVTWGEEVSVTATAKEGYVFLGWDSDREGIEGTEETITFTMPQAPVTLVANFFPKALLEGWMDTRIDAKVDGERLMTADQAAEKTAAAIEGKVESGELFTPAGAEAKTAEAIAQKVANKELITADSLQEMALDAPVIEVDASGTAKVGISLQKSTSLSGEWQAVELAEDSASVAAGALKLSVPAEEGTAFYKFVVPARQGAQEP